MKRISLKQRLLNYIRKKHPEWISGGELERVVSQETNYKPSNASRRLRELVKEEAIKREERNGTVFYCSVEPKKIETIKVLSDKPIILQNKIW